MERGRLLDYAVTRAISDHAPEEPSPSQVTAIEKMYNQFLLGVSKYNETTLRLKEIGIGTKVIDTVSEIMRTDSNPIPYKSQKNNFGSVRKRTRQWTHTEDIRLMAAILKYEIDDWEQVANFVGNGRLKCQCSQRWFRGLNPKIKKTTWTAEEDQRLFELVKLHGDKSWSKIADDMGDRCDVQCRYHYNQSRKSSNSIFFMISDANLEEEKEINGSIKIEKLNYSLNSGNDNFLQEEANIFSYFENLDLRKHIFFEHANIW